MFFADFETTTGKLSSKRTQIYLWGVKGPLKGDKLYWGLDMESFFETLKENKMNTIYFHNLSFDGNFIYKWLLDEKDYNFINQDDPKNEGHILEPGEFKWTCDERENIYILNVNYQGFIIKFLDSWKVLMSSVEDLGANIGLEKLEIDYDKYGVFKHKKEVPKKLIKYLERDIDVVINTIIKAFGIYEKKITRASMAYNDFQKYYNDNSKTKRQFSIDFGGNMWDYRLRQNVWRNVLTREQWLFINKSFQGGYTNWNQKITNKLIEVKNGVSNDINSLYPSIMMNKKIPYGKPFYNKPLGKNIVALKCILIQNAILKDKSYPPLIKKKAGKYQEAKYLKEVKYEEYTFWQEELEFIKKYYHIDYVEIKTMYFKTKWVFRDWLNEKKELKINAKDPLERDFHKGIYNSTYGKFAQNIKIGSRIFVKDGLKVKKIENIKYLVDNNDKVVKKLPKNVLRYGKEGTIKHEPFFHETDRYKHIAVASYITSQARLVLWDAIFKNLDIWLYSDTDSCYFSESPKNIEIHNSKFGAWKPEHKFNKIKVLRAKAYIFNATHAWKNNKWVKYNKLVKKISGISKEGKAKINFDNFYLGSIIKDGKRNVKNVKGGKIIYTSDFKLGKEHFV